MLVPVKNSNQTYENAWLDVSDNNDLGFIRKTLNSKLDRCSNLYLGMFKSFINKTIVTNKTYEKAKTFFIEQTNILLSGNIDIEPEYTENEFEAIEFLRLLSLEDFLK